MVQLALIFAVAALPAVGLVWLLTAAWYRKRLDEAEDRADIARDIAADAMEQLREALTDVFEPTRTGREIHGFTASELVQMAAYETELDASPRLSRKFGRFAKRTGGSDLPNT